MLSAWMPPSFNSRKRAPGPMPTLDTIGGDRGAPGPTTVRALAHQRKNRPQCRKRLTVTHAMPAVSSTVGRRVSAGGNYRIKSQRRGGHTYLGEKGIGMKRSRVSEGLLAEGLKWRHEETWFGARVDPQFERKRGRSSASTPPRLRAA